MLSLSKKDKDSPLDQSREDKLNLDTSPLQDLSFSFRNDDGPCGERFDTNSPVSNRGSSSGKQPGFFERAIAHIAESYSEQISNIMSGSDYTGLPRRLDKVIRNILLLEGTPKEKLLRALGSLELMAENHITLAKLSSFELKTIGAFVGASVIGAGVFLGVSFFGVASMGQLGLLALVGMGAGAGFVAMKSFLGELSAEINNSRPS